MYLFPQAFLPSPHPRRTMCFNSNFATLEDNLERYQKLGGFNHQAKTPTLNPVFLFLKVYVKRTRSPKKEFKSPQCDGSLAVPQTYISYSKYCSS